MNVLVTGATGYLGSWVARELVAAGHSVRALVRATSKLTNLDDLRIERVAGDVLEPDAVARALVGCDAVVHTAGIAHFLPGNTAQMYAVNGRGVEIVLGAAHAAGVRRAVLTSSTAVIGGSRTPRVADESTPSNAEELAIDYFISKRRGEQAALALAAKGLPVCVLRPVVVLGPGDIYHSSAHTFRAIAERKLPVYVPGGASFCDVRDVARAHVVALERGRPGEVYILGGHNLTIADMTATVARIAGVSPPRAVPLPLALVVATLAELGARLSGRPATLSRQLVRASALYTWVSSDKAARELDYVIRPFEQSLRDTLRFFLRSQRMRAATPELRQIAEAPSS